jgi:hypothetical protein
VPGDGDHGAELLSLEEELRRIGVLEIRRLKLLEEDNRRLKQLVAELSLDLWIP